jgi:hypothetical protein
VAAELAPFSICRSPRSVSAVRAKADMTLRQQNFGLDRYAATQRPWHFKGGFAVRPVTQETRHFQNQTRTPKAKYGRYPPSLWERVVILNRFRNMAVVGRKSAMGLGCVKNAEIEFANGNFVSTSINLKNKSAGDGYRGKTIEKTILRAFRARTFSRSQSHSRHYGDVRCWRQ